MADTLGVARSNLVEQLRGGSKPRGRYQRQGDHELLAAIRQLTDARPTYGYRRITALINRARRASGAETLNHKRVYRLMLQGGLLLQRHGTRRPIRAHEGTVIAPASNLRWSSDGLEIPCWNGEVVRLAFAIDTHDREVMAWVATTGGISGEMIRDLMLACVEQRFAALRAPHPVQWLADNGSAYAAHDTRDFAVALNLVACFTPVRSPESTDEVEQPLSADGGIFLWLTGDRVVQSEVGRCELRRAAYDSRSSVAAPVGARLPRRVHPSVRRR